MLRITAFDDPSTYGGAAWELAKREVATLQSQLSASQERERIYLETLLVIKERSEEATPAANRTHSMKYFVYFAGKIADTIRNAEEVKP